jgi:undecaprenyl phosphate-alpha-L-ara4FN deformylase
VYEEADLLYASDTRGIGPFFPRIEGRIYHTLEVPTTLPTLDELLGRPEYPEDRIVAHYLSLLHRDRPNVLTIHAEIEGMGKQTLFADLLRGCRERGVQFVRLDGLAQQFLTERSKIPVRDLVLRPIDGRSGVVAMPAP